MWESLTIAQYCAIAVAAIAAFTDIRRGKIYNWLTFPSMLAGILVTTLLWYADGNDWAHALAGLLTAVGGCAGGILIMACTKFFLKNLGHGDTKLMGALGAFIGAPLILATFFYFCLLYAVFSLTWLAAVFPWMQLFARLQLPPGAPSIPLDLQRFNSTRKKPIPIAPLICAGLVCALWLQQPTLNFIGLEPPAAEGVIEKGIPEPATKL